MTVYLPSDFVETLSASWRLPPKAAMPEHGAGVVEAKRNGGLDLLKTAVSSVIQESARNPLPVSGFFLSSVVEADVSY